MNTLTLLCLFAVVAAASACHDCVFWPTSVAEVAGYITEDINTDGKANVDRTIVRNGIENKTPLKISSLMQKLQKNLQHRKRLIAPPKSVSDPNF